MMIGKAIRLERIIDRNSKRTVIVPMDHGVTLGPIVTPKFTLDIGWPYFLLVSDLFDGNNALAIPTLTVPNDPSLSGTIFYFQGLAIDQDREIRPSNLHDLEIL